MDKVNSYKNEDSDVDSVEEYRNIIELHSKIRDYSRKGKFRHEFNNNAMIENLNITEDVKAKIFKKFDEFSERFSVKYKGRKSFLPYDYLLFRLLRDEGYEYLYICSSEKFKEMEKIYWSFIYCREYENFICFLNCGANTVCEKDYKVFDNPKKIVVSDFKNSIKNNYYLLTVKDELDIVIQYFTKFFPKINKRPEYQYVLFILEMEEENLEITFESIFLYIIELIKSRIMIIKEEIN